MKLTPDLIALVFHLKALQGGKLPATHGQFVHGAFLSILKDLSIDHFESVHRPNQPERPFTVSSLHGPFSKGIELSLIGNGDESSLPIQEGEEYWIRVTCLTRELTSILLKILETPPRWMRIRNLNFLISGISSNTHRLSGMASYADLHHQYLKKDFIPSQQIVLNFMSATAIRQQGRHQLFPLPSLIFPRLLKRWNRFSPVQINEITADDFERSLMISGYQLHTHMLDFGAEGRKIGFAGYCQYHYSAKADPHVLRVVHLLGHFSFFSGIGYGTPRGMGQVEFILTP